MNIFQVLSQGKGRLNEENLSAMLAFLLNPQQSHGLRDLFLRRFMDIVNESIGVDYSNIFIRNYKYDITLESPYEVDENKRYIDIDMKFFVDGKESLRILIENKIKVGAAQKNQFKDEYIGVINSLEDEREDLKVLMVFLTPDSESSLLKEEYDELKQEEMKNNHSKVWLKWNAQNDEMSIVKELKKILRQEADVEINPISEYMRHTTRAFIRHIIDSQTVAIVGDRYKPMENDEIVQEEIVQIDNISYRIEQYKSTAIKIINLETEEYEIARKLLRVINEKLELDVDLLLPSQTPKNTRILGRDIIKALKK